MTGKRSGFTIVEMLVVVAILGVLVGIVTTAAGTAIRQTRVKRCAAMRTVLQAGLATYYAQKGEWPGRLKNLSEKGTAGGKLRVDYLSETEADAVFQELVTESLKGSPMLDVTGLFVADVSAVGSDSSKTKVHGRDFRVAISKDKKTGNRKPRQLAYGYATQRDGVFRRFIIKYNYETDSVTVMTQNEGHDASGGYDYATEMDEKYDHGKYRWPQKPTDGV